MFECDLCDENKGRFKTYDGLIAHLSKVHSDDIPMGMSVEQYAYYLKTGKTQGSCIIDKKPTKWNPRTNKYNRLCEDPKCKDKYCEIFRKRMIGKYGKVTLLDDPEHQKKMLKNRAISGTYKWEDGGKTDYTGSYEQDFLKFLDVLMEFESTDIMAPSPHTYYYKYEGKKHFYIPDFFIPSLNLEIEIKDGGNNPNNHHKIKDVDKVKEKLKDEVLMSQSEFSYIKITNKQYDTFFEFLFKSKEQFAKLDKNKDADKAPIFIIGESVEEFDSEHLSTAQQLHELIKAWDKEDSYHCNFIKARDVESDDAGYSFGEVFSLVSEYKEIYIRWKESEEVTDILGDSHYIKEVPTQKGFILYVYRKEMEEVGENHLFNPSDWNAVELSSKESPFFEEERYYKKLETAICDFVSNIVSRKTLTDESPVGKYTLVHYTTSEPVDGDVQKPIKVSTIELEITDEEGTFEYNVKDTDKDLITIEAYSFIVDTELLSESLKAVERNKLKDSDFGLPKERKYPIHNTEHVELAIKFFNYVKKEDEKELAKNIIEKIDAYGIRGDINLSKKNKFYRYFSEYKDTKSGVTESYELDLSDTSDLYDDELIKEIEEMAIEETIVMESFINRMSDAKIGKKITLKEGEKEYNPKKIGEMVSPDTFITADLHVSFFTENDNERIEKVLEGINSTCSADDHLIILGDLSDKKTGSFEDTKDFISKIHCKNLYLVLGNNDIFSIEQYVDMGFKSVVCRVEIDDCVFSHFPDNETDKINIHGHIHGTRDYLPGTRNDNRIDAWCGCTDFKPVTIKEAYKNMVAGIYR